MKITNNKGYGYVYETAGQVPTMHMAFELAANKAHVCFIGTPHVDLSFTPKQWENMNRKEFKLTGSLDVLQFSRSREKNGSLPHIILLQDN